MRTTLALALGLAGCMTSVAPGGGAASLCTDDVATMPFVAPADGPVPDALCAQVSASLCAQFERCGCVPSGDDTMATCLAATGATCAAFFTGPDVRDALARGTLVWDGARAADFVARLATASEADDPIVLDGSSMARGTVPVGATCVVLSGAFTECVDGASCLPASDGPRCAWDAVLSPYQDERQACVPGAGACTASPALRCVPRCDGSASPGVCEPAMPDGAACTADADCSGATCRDGACTTLAALSAACVADADCTSGVCEHLHCASPPLAPPPPGAYVGAACAAPEDCQTRSCVGGTCATPACTARLDPTGFGLYRAHPAVFTARP